MNATTSEGSKFDERCREYFRNIIETKWECEEHDGICVVTDDKQHFHLSERHIKRWIEGIGKLDTGHPPEGMYEEIRNGAVWNRHTGEMVVKAVHDSPSRRRASSISSISSASSASSKSASFRSVASGASGPGYFMGLLLEKIGTSVLGSLDKYRYQRNVDSCLKRWAKLSDLGPKERKEILEMLAIAVLLSRPHYSPKDNRLGFECGKRIQEFLDSFNLSQTPEDARLRIQVQTCLLPLLFTELSNKVKDAVAGDLAWELSTELLRAPIGLSDGEVTEFESQMPVRDTAGILIFIVGRELAYSPKCAFRYPWLPLYLITIIQSTLRIRKLRQVELDIIWELVWNRQRLALENNFKKDNRSWEVALFALCGDEHPRFKNIVLGSIGIPALVKSLQVLLSPRASVDEMSWEDVAFTARVFAFLSEIGWTFGEESITKDTLNTLCEILGRGVPQRWIVVHYWVLTALYNIVAQRRDCLDPPVMSNLLTALDIAESAISSIPATTQKRPRPFLESKLLLEYKKKAPERIILLRESLQAQGNRLPLLKSLNLGGPFESSESILNFID